MAQRDRWHGVQIVEDLPDLLGLLGARAHRC
jgi:hypothetical protein